MICFTLEYCLGEDDGALVWNLPPELLPTYLEGEIKLADWQSFTSDAMKVARESIDIKAQADNVNEKEIPLASWGGLLGGKTKKREEIVSRKAVAQKQSEETWNTLLNRKAIPLFVGYSLSLLRDPQSNSIYGIQFSRSSPGTVSQGCNKITLKYDYRQGKWNHNQASLHQAAKLIGVTAPASWSQTLLRRADEIVKHQIQRQVDQKRNLNQQLNKRLHLAWKGDVMEEGAIRGYVNGVAKQMQLARVVEMRTEMEWKQLESAAKDYLLASHHTSVDVALLVNDSLNLDRPYLYSGLELRLVRS